jgi:hypothetical protein
MLTFGLGRAMSLTALGTLILLFFFYPLPVLASSSPWYCTPQRPCDPSDCVVTSSLSPSSTSASFLLTATTTTRTALYVEYEPTDPVSGVPRLRSLPSTCGTSHTVSLDRLVASTSYSYDMYYLRDRHPFTPVRILSGTFMSSPLPSTLAAVDVTRVAQFIAICRRSKWSKHLTNSPFLALLAIVGSNAARKMSSACSHALC